MWRVATQRHIPKLTCTRSCHAVSRQVLSCNGRVTTMSLCILSCTETVETFLTYIFIYYMYCYMPCHYVALHDLTEQEWAGNRTGYTMIPNVMLQHNVICNGIALCSGLQHTLFHSHYLVYRVTHHNTIIYHGSVHN